MNEGMSTLKIIDDLEKEILKLRKELDLERENHQLTQLRYDNVKNAINKEVDRLNKGRPAVEIPADEKGDK
jgi:hypothetical protein